MRWSSLERGGGAPLSVAYLSETEGAVAQKKTPDWKVLKQLLQPIRFSFCVLVPVETAQQLRAKNGSSQRLFHTLLAEEVSCDFPNRSRLHRNNTSSCWHTVIYKPLYRREKRSFWGKRGGKKKKKLGFQKLAQSTKTPSWYTASSFKKKKKKGVQVTAKSRKVTETSCNIFFFVCFFWNQEKAKGAPESNSQDARPPDPNLRPLDLQRRTPTSQHQKHSTVVCIKQQHIQSSLMGRGGNSELAKGTFNSSKLNEGEVDPGNARGTSVRNNVELGEKPYHLLSFHSWMNETQTPNTGLQNIIQLRSYSNQHQQSLNIGNVAPT